MARYIVALGGTDECQTFYGPFADYESAVEWAEAEAGGLQWEIHGLGAPES